MVKIKYDEWGRKLTQSDAVDLSLTQLIHIVGPLRQMSSYQTEKMGESGPLSKKNPIEIIQEFAPPAIVALVMLTLLYIILKI